MVASCGNTLRVLAAERLGESFNAASEKLRYTPRELTVHPDLRTIAIVEADQSCVPFARREGPEGPAGERLPAAPAREKAAPTLRTPTATPTPTRKTSRR